MKSCSPAPLPAARPIASALSKADPALRLRVAVLACALSLPMLASAAPLLTTRIGPFGIGSSTCLRDTTQTASAGPLVDAQTCTRDVFGPQSATAFATADFGSLGASTVLSMTPARLVTPSITGATNTSFQAEYVFSGPGTSVPVELNLDLDGLLAVSGERSSAFVQIVLQVLGVTRTARIEIRDSGLVLTEKGLDGDVDFSSLLELAGGSVEIDSESFAVPVGVPVTMRLALVTGGALSSAGGGGTLNSISDFDSTLTFNRDGPVFTMPAGFTVNGPGVVDNRWIGALPPGAVPEPGSLVLAALGLAGLFAPTRRAGR